MKVCVDLGATNVKVSLIDGGVILSSASYPTEATSLEGIIRSLDGAIALVYDGKDDRVDAICISSAGTIDVESGEVVYATDNLRGYTGFNVKRYINGKYGLPCAVINDGHAALLGELFKASSLLDKRVAMIVLGSGVGGAYAVNGRIVANEQNDFARFGHVQLIEGGLPCNCGKSGCIEQYLSGRAINRLAALHGIERDCLFKLYLEGDGSAKAVFNELKEYFRLSLEKINELCPFDVMIVGGGAADGMKEAFYELAAVDGFDVRRAIAGNHAGMLGAYYLGKDL